MIFNPGSEDSRIASKREAAGIAVQNA